MWIWLGLACVGAVLFGLTLSGVLMAKPWRLSGLALSLVALMLSASYLPINLAFLSWLLLMVLVIVALPWTSWLLGQDNPPARANKGLAV